MAFWQKWFKKKEGKEAPWEEIFPEEVPSVAGDTMEKPLMNAVCGRCSPLETKALLEDFIAKGWEQVKTPLAKMAGGKIPAAPWVLELLFAAYPEECGKWLLPYAEEMPIKNRLALFAAVGGEYRSLVVPRLVALLPQLDAEDLGSALRILALYPTDEGNAAIAALLTHEDWRIAMKAASALGEAAAKEYLPDLRAAAAKGGILGDGIEEIIKKLED